MKNNIVEPLRVGLQEIIAATEASTMILRIDDVIASKTGRGSSSYNEPYPGMDEE